VAAAGGRGGKRLDAWVLELHDYLDQAEAAARTNRAALATPFIWRLSRLWKAREVSPLELMRWPALLVEWPQACDVVERQRSPGTGPNLLAAE
jgi:hypothetical protein